ncbi:MAG: substrate-binding domain-containing protein [Pseudomonadota bacterium]|nr:substrate-binding domain-containing protein [Pseudomonadota bacterium]
MLTVRRLVLCAAILLAAALPAATASAQSIVLQSANALRDSGFYTYILPIFEAESGITVSTRFGSAQEAVNAARLGEADVLIVGAKALEDAFVADGYGVKRHNLMYTDMVLVGPPENPAQVQGPRDVIGALEQIAETGAPFLTRGDGSGAARRVNALWEMAEIDPTGTSWYRVTGKGAVITLNETIKVRGYAIVDRASWLMYANKRDYVILVERDQRMRRHFGITRVSEKRFPRLRPGPAQSFVDWMLSPRGQKAITEFQVEGQNVFRPQAGSIPSRVAS